MHKQAELWSSPFWDSEWLIQIELDSYHVHGTVCRIIPAYMNAIATCSSRWLNSIGRISCSKAPGSCLELIFNRVCHSADLARGLRAAQLSSRYYRHWWLSLEFILIFNAFPDWCFSDVAFFLHALVAGWSLELETLCVNLCTCAFFNVFFGLVHPHTSLSWELRVPRAWLLCSTLPGRFKRCHLSRCRLGKSLPWIGKVFHLRLRVHAVSSRACRAKESRMDGNFLSKFPSLKVV